MVGGGGTGCVRSGRGRAAAPRCPHDEWSASPEVSVAPLAHGYREGGGSWSFGVAGFRASVHRRNPGFKGAVVSGRREPLGEISEARFPLGCSGATFSERAPAPTPASEGPVGGGLQDLLPQVERVERLRLNAGDRRPQGPRTTPMGSL